MKSDAIIRPVERVRIILFRLMKNAAEPGGIVGMQLLDFLGALALLICDTAAGLASRLARGLALAAAAVLCAFAQVAGLNSFDVLHNFHLSYIV